MPVVERKPGGSLAGVYEEDIFTSQVNDTIRRFALHLDRRKRTSAISKSSSIYGDSEHLFLLYATHVPHTPMQMPQKRLDQFLRQDDQLSLTGKGYAAMVSVLDKAVGVVTTALQDTGLYNNTLLVFQSDNGGPIYDVGFIIWDSARERVRARTCVCMCVCCCCCCCFDDGTTKGARQLLSRFPLASYPACI